VLGDKYNGYFVELGACDGILYSNTKTIEDFFGFNGILIEPIKRYYNSLIVNRPKQKNYNFAISNSTEKFVKFVGEDAEAGIVDFINKKNNETEYEVENKKLSEVINQSELKYIDIMIIDVEGAELSVIESIDFDFPIYCIFFEAHSNQQDKNKQVGNFLKENGFIYKERQRGNEVWYNPNYFRRHLFDI
jgi:FkbM family methyltransferase